MKPKSSLSVVVSENTKSLPVYTESKCKLYRVRRVGKKDMSEELLAQMQEFGRSHLKFNSYLENLFIEKTKGMGIKLKREVYFNIGGKSYFLDFLDEDINVAIEIDGTQHEAKVAKEKDISRDSAFAFLGIATLRVSKDDLLALEFQTDFYLRYKEAVDVAKSLRNRDYADRMVLSYKTLKKRIKERLSVVVDGFVLITPHGTRQLFLGDYSDKFLYYDNSRKMWYYEWLGSADYGGRFDGGRVFPSFNSNDSPVKVKIKIEVEESARQSGLSMPPRKDVTRLPRDKEELLLLRRNRRRPEDLWTKGTMMAWAIDTMEEVCDSGDLTGVGEELPNYDDLPDNIFD